MRTRLHEPGPTCLGGRPPCRYRRVVGYWRNLLAPLSPEAALPTDRPTRCRPRGRSYDPVRTRGPADRLAAYVALLHRYSGAATSLGVRNLPPRRPRRGPVLRELCDGAACRGGPRSTDIAADAGRGVAAGPTRACSSQHAFATAWTPPATRIRRGRRHRADGGANGRRRRDLPGALDLALDVVPARCSDVRRDLFDVPPWTACSATRDPAADASPGRRRVASWRSPPRRNTRCWSNGTPPSTPSRRHLP